MAVETFEESIENMNRFTDGKNVIRAQVSYLCDLAEALQLAGNVVLANRLLKIAGSLKFGLQECSDAWEQEFKWKVAGVQENTNRLLEGLIVGALIAGDNPPVKID